MLARLMLHVFDSQQLAHAPALELHNGGWVEHVDRPSRSESITARIGAHTAATDFGMAPLARVHATDYLDFLANAHARWLAAGRTGDAIGYTWPVVGRRPMRLDRIDALLGRYSYDAATPIAAGTWTSAYWSAQSALTALVPLLDGSERTTFALCRPPGHHAGADYLGGYCYLNNAAIAARAATDRGVQRVAILDVDYHHGNGTQDIFYEDAGVFFASLHGDPVTEYPFYWGHADERGAGPGEGHTLNLPLPRGTTVASYIDALDRSLDAIVRYDPALVIVSVGAYTFVGDPICHFQIATTDYPRISERIAKLARPTLIVMEGGYAVGALGDNVAAFLSGF
jgi:acetoin utilization deacetylase AcuC-like enzyme